jgi:hypothetical protein
MMIERTNEPSSPAIPGSPGIPANPPPRSGAASAGSGAVAAGNAPPAQRRATWKLYLLILLCIAPVVASYLAYYVFPPSERTNYGMLVEPQRPVPALAATLVRAPDTGVGQALASDGLGALKGKWILLVVDQGACDRACAEKLYFVRQTHAALGKDRDRVQQVLLLTDAASLPAAVDQAHPGMAVLRVSPQSLGELLPVESTTTAADHIYLIDPLHNLMMRFPKDPDPARTRKDLQKLLKASRIG